jgi:glyoxylate reductase
MKVVVSRPLPGNSLEKLNKEGHQVQVMSENRCDRDFFQAAESADALITMLSDKIDSEKLQTLGKQLKVIANFAVGYNNIDIKKCAQRGINVCNTPEVLTAATADTAMLLILMCARRAKESMDFLNEGKFSGWRPKLLLGQDLQGKTLGILGMGRIGEAVARRAESFGMNIMYHTRSGAKTHLAYPAVSFETLLVESDFLSIHCPLTEKTRHLFTLKQFRQMKNSAVLINTARGPVVKESDLARALKEKEIFYAGCDVYENEPEVDKQLLACKNAVLFPHIGSGTLETREKMAEMTVNSILQVFAGKNPELSVNADLIDA